MGPKCIGVAFAAGLVGTGLIGCGEKPEPLYAPTSVEDAWKNHQNAFMNQDLERIMLDYDSESKLYVCDHTCDRAADCHEHTSTVAIKTYWKNLFADFGDVATMKSVDFPLSSESDAIRNPRIDGDNSAVFLLWRKEASNIEQATETYTFTDKFKFKLHYMDYLVKNKDCTAVPGAATELSAATTGTTGHFGYAAYRTSFFQGFSNDASAWDTYYAEDARVEVFSWAKPVQMTSVKVGAQRKVELRKLFDAYGCDTTPMTELKSWDGEKSFFMVLNDAEKGKTGSVTTILKNNKIQRQFVVVKSLDYQGLVTAVV